MEGWQDVAREFRELEPILAQTRLERQWDEATEDWRLSGRLDLEGTARFRAAAAAAGALLAGHALAPALVQAIENPETRWFRALWEMAGPHAPPVVGMMSMHGRKSAGPVSLGRIPQPAKISAELAERLAGA